MTPTKFQHAGFDWIPHTPGDPMPCPDHTLVRVLLRNRSQGDGSAWVGNWSQISGGYGLEIIGWHPIEEQPSLTKQCANCRWSKPLEWRYDQVMCCNQDSDDAYGEVEATHHCAHFEQPSLARRVLDLLEAGDIEQAKHELRKELE